MKKNIALCITIAAVLVATQLQVEPIWAAETMNATGSPSYQWIEDALAAIEPLIGAQAIGLIAAFIFSFLGKWANHEAWTWKKFELTLKVAIINGFIFTALNILTGWTFADIQVWISEIAGLYIMQKFLTAIGPYLSPSIAKVKPQ